jgi:hypothetical protein
MVTRRLLASIAVALAVIAPTLATASPEKKSLPFFVRVAALTPGGQPTEAEGGGGVSVSDDGSRVAWRVITNLGDMSSWLQDFRANKARPLWAAPGGVAIPVYDGPHLSADGRIVSFFSTAANGRYALIARRLDTGAIQVLSELSDGSDVAPNPNAGSYGASPNGRFVVFHGDDTNKVFVHDLALDRTDAVTIAFPNGGPVPPFTPGQQPAVDDGTPLFISDDGHFIAFEIFWADSKGRDGSYTGVYDRQNGVTQWIGAGDPEQLTGDARYVLHIDGAHESLFDRATNSSRTLSFLVGGKTVMPPPSSTVLADDSRHAVFSYLGGVYTGDLTTKTTRRLDLNPHTCRPAADSSPDDSDAANSGELAISDNGRYVVFKARPLWGSLNAVYGIAYTLYLADTSKPCVKQQTDPSR